MIVEKSYCPTSSNGTPINKRDRIYIAGGAELMWEAPTEFERI